MKETYKAHAKINLSLDVTGRRDDGYHIVKMIMQTIDLCDDVTVEITDKKGIFLKTNIPYLPKNRKNIAYKAAEMFLKETGIGDIGIRINIFKRIPVAAGLAGGSTDAAAVLILLNRLLKTEYSEERLMQIGLKLGADVPYCIKGGTMLADGIGEILTPLKPFKNAYIVLCKPPFSVSTAEIYSKINLKKLDKRPDTDGIIKAIENDDYFRVSHRLYNVMEEVTSSMHKEIGEIKSILIENNADGAVMSGSGPSTYGIFKDQGQAQKAYNALKLSYQTTFLTKVYNPE